MPRHLNDGQAAQERCPGKGLGYQRDSYAEAEESSKKGLKRRAMPKGNTTARAQLWPRAPSNRSFPTTAAAPVLAQQHPQFQAPAAPARPGWALLGAQRPASSPRSRQQPSRHPQHDPHPQATPGPAAQSPPVPLATAAPSAEESDAFTPRRAA